MKSQDDLMFPKMEPSKESSRKQKLFEIIFEAETFYGKLFDVTLLILILTSVILVTLESVPVINAKHHHLLVILEWVITILFTAEYVTRIMVVKKPWRYIFSFYGIIDLLSILPSYLGIIYPSTKFLTSIRILRLFRIFRIFKLTKLLQGGNTILIALKRNRSKFVVFATFITVMVVLLGCMIYVLEGDDPASPMTSIPVGIYWAAVTLTTVGYGDITPVSAGGRFLATVVMILGYGIIVIQGWFIGKEAVHAHREMQVPKNTLVCRHCHDSHHMDGANFCKTCGYPLHGEE